MEYNNYKSRLKECQHDNIIAENITKKMIKVNNLNVKVSYCPRCQEEIKRRLVSSGEK